MPRLPWAGKPLTVFLLLLALSSRPLSAGSLEFGQPISNLDPTPHFTPVKIYIHLSSQDSISAWSRAGPGESELQGFLLLVRHVETRWTRLLSSFAFMLGGTWPSHTWLIKPGSLSLHTHRDPRLPLLLFICGCSRWRRWGRI